MEVNPKRELSLSEVAFRNHARGTLICEPVPNARAGFQYHSDIQGLALRITTGMKNDKSDTPPIVLLQVTDPHLHAAADSKMRGVNTYETLLAVLEHVQQDERWPPAAIVATGDLVQDESHGGYERFKSCFDELGLPIYCIPGNHDDPELMHAVLADPPFQVCGEAVLGTWQLVLLSTFVKGEDAGAVGAEQLSAMDSYLSENTERPTMIFMHHQPVAMGSAWLDGVGLMDADEFLPVIERHPHVRAVVWGHVHQALEEQRGDVRFLSTPSTCAQFLPRKHFFAIDDKPPGCRWLVLHADGSIETTVDWLQT